MLVRWSPLLHLVSSESEGKGSVLLSESGEVVSLTPLEWHRGRSWSTAFKMQSLAVDKIAELYLKISYHPKNQDLTWSFRTPLDTTWKDRKARTVYKCVTVAMIQLFRRTEVQTRSEKKHRSWTKWKFIIRSKETPANEWMKEKAEWVKNGRTRKQRADTVHLDNQEHNRAEEEPNRAWSSNRSNARVWGLWDRDGDRVYSADIESLETSQTWPKHSFYMWETEWTLSS